MQSVTEIVGEVYPYIGSSFQKSLSYDSLTGKDLLQGGIAEMARELDATRTMSILNLYGSFVHRMAKRLSLGHDVVVDDPLLSPIRLHLLDFIRRYDVSPVLNEWTFQLPGEYSGTLDMVCELEWKSVQRICVLDFKTYGLYKDIYGIIQKDKDTVVGKKLKHVGLQTSLYANALEKLRPDLINDRALLLLLAWVTPEGVFITELDYNIDPYTQWKARQW